MASDGGLKIRKADRPKANILKLSSDINMKKGKKKNFIHQPFRLFHTFGADSFRSREADLDESTTQDVTEEHRAGQDGKCIADERPCIHLAVILLLDEAVDWVRTNACIPQGEHNK